MRGSWGIAGVAVIEERGAVVVNERQEGASDELEICPSMDHDNWKELTARDRGLENRPNITF